ncbi:MAG: hypothetical protein KAJ35_03330 [Thermoplasmata archaeon]|nr:hypothetical protein [Thermoplasmata archaeon]
MRSRFMALFVALMMMGPAMVALAADGPQPDPNSADRTDNAHVNILDITGYPDDDDGDGLYDGVQVVSRVNFTRSGNYYLHVKFMPTDGSWWLSAAETQNIEKAPTEVYFEVRFEGWKIRNRNYTGYLVAEVSILDPANNNAILATHSETLDRYFRVWEWEPTWTGARVTGFDRAVSKDFDGNGKYELAELPINITATTPGLYRVVLYYTWERSGISSVNGKLNQYTITNWTHLDVGHNQVPMWVSGAHITQADSITVTAQVYKGAFPGAGLTRTLTVQSREVYEAPTLRGLYDGTHIEVAQDRDGDEMAEALRITVGLDVNIPGDYTLTAVLGPEGTLFYDGATADTSLINRHLANKEAAKSTMTWTYKPGDRQAWFSFDGRLLNTWDYDGAYDVIVFAWGPKPTIATVFKFTTKEFTADQFLHPVPPLQFTVGHTDEGVLNPQTGLLDGLRVTYNAKINMPGTYTAFAVLSYKGQEFAATRVEGYLPAGDATITVTFRGDAIYNSKAEGEFTATVWVTGAGVAWNDTTLEHPMTARYNTGAYSWKMFSPPKLTVGPKDPQPVEDLDFILLRTGLMVVRVDRDRPDLTFYMTDDDGRTALFRVVYNRLLAFSDVNEDGAPQANEIAYTAPLLAYDWELSEVMLAEDPETGRVATFDLTATIDLVENDPLASELGRPLFTVEDFAKVTLSFTLTSRDVNHTDDVGEYMTLGGAELKVDILIDVLSPVEGIDLLTVEQVLKDDRGTYLPKTTEDNAAGEPEPDELRRYKETVDLKQRIEFRQSADTPAFYSWVKKAEVTRSDGTQEVTDVLAAYIVTDGRMLLYLSYPYDVETVSIFHDPSLGIYEGGFPGIPEEWKAIFDPLLFGVSALAAVAMVVALRSRGGRKEEDIEMDDEPLETVQERGPPSEPVDPSGIPQLPEEPQVTNGSTILPQPPPVARPPRPGESQEDWAEWQD